MQPPLLQDLQRARLNPRLQPQLDNSLEVSVDEEDLDADRPHLSRPLPFDEPMWIQHRDRSR